MVKKSVVALATVTVLTLLFVVSLVSATQLLSPRDMPFGVTGSSPVVDAVQQEYSLDLVSYATEADLIAAADRGDIYGGYVPADSGDVLVTVPAKSFFGEVYVRAGFADAAKQSNATFTTTTVAPLPIFDRVGGVVGLLLLPTLVGGYLVASLFYSFTQRAAVRGRISSVLGISVLVALITGTVAGPVLGAIPTSSMWPLLPAFALVTAAVALASVAIQGVLGKAGTLVVALLFVVVGGASAGGVGPALLPTYWQWIGRLLPPRHAVELYRNVRYFGGNNIGEHVAVLLGYALVAVVVILLLERRATPDASAEPASSEPLQGDGKERRRVVAKDVVAPGAFALVLTTLFAVNYMASAHSPVAQDMPFGVVGSTSLAEAAQNDNFSLDLMTYADHDAATDAMDRGEIYGAVIMDSSPIELVLVSSISDLSPLDIAANFEEAAGQQGVTITPKAYAPTPLAPKDPFALVTATSLIALLVGGYMAAALMANTTGSASDRWRGLWFAGFAVVTGLLVDIVLTFWLQGLPSDAFWIVWPIMSLIMLAVALFTAVLRRLLGPAGVIVAVIMLIQFGNPSSGGANGVPYLPSFWQDLGPFLPPRNAYLLLRNTVYFEGNGIAQALAVLLVYTVAGAAILGFLDWFRSPEASVPGLDEDSAASAAGVAAPVGPLP